MKTNTSPAPAPVSEYDAQAAAFLARFALSLTIKPAKANRPAPWAKGEKSGNRYRVTLKRDGAALAFDFWGSIADAEKLDKARRALSDAENAGIPSDEVLRELSRAINAAHPSAYDVLACISADTYCPDSFADFCGEYGYAIDSRAALATFRRCDRFAKRLRAFFSEKEIAALVEIQ